MKQKLFTTIFIRRENSNCQSLVKLFIFLYGNYIVSEFGQQIGGADQVVFVFLAFFIFSHIHMVAYGRAVITIMTNIN